MSASTTERYNDFGETLHINLSYILCVGSVGQYRFQGGKKYVSQP